MMMGIDVSCYTLGIISVVPHKALSFRGCCAGIPLRGLSFRCQEKGPWIGLIQAFYTNSGRLLGESWGLLSSLPTAPPTTLTHIHTHWQALRKEEISWRQESWLKLWFWLLQAGGCWSVQVSGLWTQVLPLKSKDHGTLDSYNGHRTEILRGRSWWKWEVSKAAL